MASEDILVSRPAARTSPDGISPLADHDDRLCRYCVGCDLWLNYPTEKLQSFLPTSNDTTSRVLIKAVEEWSSGEARGCLLCDLVELSRVKLDALMITKFPMNSKSGHMVKTDA